MIFHADHIHLVSIHYSPLSCLQLILNSFNSTTNYLANTQSINPLPRKRSPSILFPFSETFSMTWQDLVGFLWPIGQTCTPRAKHMMGIWIGNAEGGGTDWRAFDMGTVAVGACGAVSPFLDRETKGKGSCNTHPPRLHSSPYRHSGDVASVAECKCWYGPMTAWGYASVRRKPTFRNSSKMKCGFVCCSSALWSPAS